MKKVLLLAVVISAFTFTIAFPAVAVDMASRIWVDESFGMLDLNLFSVDIDSSGSRVLCMTDRVVYLSENAGKTWEIVFRAFETLDSDQEMPEDLPEETELDDMDLELRQDFDRSDYDSDDLFDWGIIETDEELDDVSDDELQKRLEEADLLEKPELDDGEVEPVRQVDPYEFRETPTFILNQVRWDTFNPLYAFLATSNGLYISSDWGRTWSKTRIQFFNETEPVLSVTVVPPSGNVVIALSKGLLISKDHGFTFTELQGFPQDQTFRDLDYARHVNNTIAAISDSSICWGELGDMAEIKPVQTLVKKAEVVAITITPDGRIVTAGESALFFPVETDVWESVLISEFLGLQVRDIDYADDHIIIATDRGVYFWNMSTRTGRFRNNGLTDFNIRDIAVNPANRSEVWLATVSGLFALKETVSVDTVGDAALVLPEDFPNLETLTQATLAFAEINITRNKNLHHLAKRSALYPQIDLDCRITPKQRLQYSKSPLVWISGGVGYIGPIDEKYEDWDREKFRIQIRLAWNPDKFWFNRDRFAVQTRLRREVERRRQVEKDVQFLYVSLVRLLSEIQFITEERMKLEMAVRIQQIQAQLDALTGYSFEKLAQNQIVFSKIFQGEGR